MPKNVLKTSNIFQRKILFCWLQIMFGGRISSSTRIFGSDAESDDESLNFFKKMIPLMMMGAAAKLRSSKRRRNQRQKVRKRARVRRRWQQRRAGDIKPEDFTWWRLINKHDVTDVNSRNGKVCNHCVCVSLRFVF